MLNAVGPRRPHRKILPCRRRRCCRLAHRPGPARPGHSADKGRIPLRARRRLGGRQQEPAILVPRPAGSRSDPLVNSVSLQASRFLSLPLIPILGHATGANEPFRPLRAQIAHTWDGRRVRPVQSCDVITTRIDYKPTPVGLTKGSFSLRTQRPS